MKLKKMWIMAYWSIAAIAALKIYEYNASSNGSSAFEISPFLINSSAVVVFVVSSIIIFLLSKHTGKWPEKGEVCSRNIPVALSALAVGVFSAADLVLTKNITDFLPTDSQSSAGEYLKLLFSFIGLIGGLTPLVFLLIALSFFSAKNILQKIPFLAFTPIIYFCSRLLAFASMEPEYLGINKFPDIATSFKPFVYIFGILLYFSLLKLLLARPGQDTFRYTFNFAILSSIATLVYSVAVLRVSIIDIIAKGETIESALHGISMFSFFLFSISLCIYLYGVALDNHDKLFNSEEAVYNNPKASSKQDYEIFEEVESRVPIPLANRKNRFNTTITSNTAYFKKLVKGPNGYYESKDDSSPADQIIKEETISMDKNGITAELKRLKRSAKSALSSTAELVLTNSFEFSRPIPDTGVRDIYSSSSGAASAVDSKGLHSAPVVSMDEIDDMINDILGKQV